MASKIKVDQIDTTLGTGNVTIDPDNNTLVVDTDNSRVGIGGSPEAKLHISTGGGIVPFASSQIVSESAGNNYIELNGGSASTTALYFGDSADQDAGGVLYNHSNDSMSLRVNASSRLVIDSSGKVGIGTTNPDAAGLTISSGGGEMIHLISSHSNKAHIEAESSNGSMWRIGTLDSNPDVTLQAMHSSGDIRFETNGGDDAFLIQNDGAFRGKLLFNGTPNFGPNGTWTSTGQSLSSYPNATVFQITITMQNIALYTAAMLVYKTSNGQYFEMSNVSNSGINIRMNGATIETNQTSGANQTGSAGNMRIAYGGGQFA